MRAVLAPSSSAEGAPRRGGRACRAAAGTALRIMGWRFDGGFPDVPKGVLVVAPHTSNWDFVIGALALLAQDLRITWLGKHSLFWWPLGALMRWLGGVPVRRGVGAGTVDQTIALLRERQRVLVALAPEGTRRHVAKWRSGFSRIASGAAVPVIPVGLDWSGRRIKLGAPVEVSGRPETDEATLRPFFDDTRARRPSRTHH